MLCNDIEKGTIDESVRMPADLREKLLKKLKPNPKRAAQLRAEFRKGFDDPIVPRIWKRCGWMYGMGTGALSHYQQRLRRYIGEEMPIHDFSIINAAGDDITFDVVEKQGFTFLPCSHRKQQAKM